ncbi:hypothetical protein [Ralstonia pseudosolanacearum]|uniref:hypothetical protein n=1 Tax=Ralstonia pseudosolanacearum TaxID=1310165 RepID=UPI001FF96E86|nr:hypothetical protein [Ralstonia pseudosolanacearum]
MQTVALISDMYGRFGDHRYMDDWTAWWSARGFSVHSIFVDDLVPGCHGERAACNAMQDGLHARLTEVNVVAQAQKALLDRLLSLSPHMVLGFSYGGFLAGSVHAQLAPAATMICISATRLRQILPLPSSDGIHLIFGGSDPFRPEAQLLALSGLAVLDVPNAGHEVYRDTAACAGYVADVVSGRMAP